MFVQYMFNASRSANFSGGKLVSVAMLFKYLPPVSQSSSKAYLTDKFSPFPFLHLKIDKERES